MNSFGWLASVEYSKHLSAGDDARFSCLLVTNWARNGPGWTQTADDDIPKLSEAQCRADFGDWLTPWRYGPVQWQLWMVVETPALKLVPLQAHAVSTAAAPSNTQARALRQQGADTLGSMAAGHTDAMKLCVDGVHTDSSPVLSYPIAVAGMAHMPAALSESVFGLSAVLSVSVVGTGLTGRDRIIATPIFASSTHTQITPDPASIAKMADGSWAVNYNAGDLGAVANYAVSVVVQAAGLDQPFTPVTATGAALIGAGRPLRAIYADVGQRLFPAAVWLNALVPQIANLPSDTRDNVEGGAGLPAFLATFLYWLGCGEDELDAPPSRACHSIFEMFVEADKDGGKLFPPTPTTIPWQDALRERYIASIGQPGIPAAFLTNFSQNLKAAGELTLAQDVDALISPDAKSPITTAEVQHAWRIVRAMTSGATVSVSVWACWLRAIIAQMAPLMNGDKAISDAIQQRLAADARFAHDYPGTANPQALLLQDDPARLIAGKLDEADSFWEDLHAAWNISQALTNGLNAKVRDAVANRQALSTQQQANADTYLAGQTASLGATDAPDARVADDSALRIRYVAPVAGKLDDTQENLRGYLICLRAGLPVMQGAAKAIDAQQPVSGPVWINDTEARLMLRDASGNPSKGDVLIDGSNKPIRLHEPTGATMNDGLLDVEVAYDGRSLQAFDADAPDMTPALLSPFSPQDPAFPRMGYGMVYQGLATMVDNAGVIIDPALRDTVWPGEPVSPPTSAFTGPTFSYLSGQTPGLASFTRIDDCGLTEETLTFAALAANVRKTLDTASAPTLRDALASGALTHSAKVVVLYDGPDYEQPHTSETFTLYAPDCSTRFIQRWLNADWLSDPGSAFRWNRISTATRDQIDQLIQNAMDEATLQTDVRRKITNPAVIALRVSATWFDEMGKAFGEDDGGTGPKTLPLKHVCTPLAWQWDEQFKVVAQRGPSRHLSIDAKGDVVLQVPPGMRAQLSVQSVVDPVYFLDDVRGRFASTLIQDFGTEQDGMRVSPKGATQWVESLSDVAVCIPDGFRTSFDLIYPKTNADAPELSLSMEGNVQLPARWLRGFTVAPRRWRWSGYPVEMPAATTPGATAVLDDWLPLYAGTDNALPTHPDGTFSTDIDPAQGWVTRACLMQPIHLPGQPVAMHMGLELTPVLRFRSILKRAVVDAVEQDPGNRVFRYDVLRGTTPWNNRLRLPVPVWSEHIPLTQTLRTRMQGTPRAEAAAKGVLLLLDDVMYDTSDGTALGGVGERLDLDVVGTWHESTTELGPNPIFHGAPNGPMTVPRLVLDPPFGLSYDQTVAGAPAQTAVVLRPAEGDGRWLLARVRLRRYVDPDFRADPPLPGAPLFTLPLRQSESDWVPCDVAVDASAATPAMQLFVDHAPYTIVVPPDPAGMPAARRYLVSWEKGRWSGATPVWRAHVALQVRRGTSSTWDTVGIVGAYAQRNLPDLRPDSALQLSVPGLATAPVMRQVLMSDFTDARWVSLIGSFEQASLGDATRYAFVSLANGIAIVPRDGAPLPVVRPNNDLRPSLLLLFRAQPDVMRGSLEMLGGMLVGVYCATPAAAPACHFDTAVLSLGNVPPESCQAVLISLQQRHTGSAPVSIDKDGWVSLKSNLFPSQQTSTTEATMRLLPEFLGPISAGMMRPQ